MEKGVLHATERGTPQGGVISPLLANIAFHGMEAAVGVKHIARGDNVGKRALVDTQTTSWRSARPRKTPTRQRPTSASGCKGRAQLSEAKNTGGPPSDGFDFLGFNVRHYPTPETSRAGSELSSSPAGTR